MAKMRDLIAMSEAEVAAFLAEARSLNVATLGKDGAPHLTTLWFTVKDGAILFETYGKSQKVLNIQRDPRVAVLCEAGETYDQLRGVSIRGRAEIVAEGAELLRLMSLLIDHHFPGQSPEALAAKTAKMAEKRIVVVVRPEKTMSWDHRKLGGKGPV
jgi:PPOX class probable F420-dependent enzyme